MNIEQMVECLTCAAEMIQTVEGDNVEVVKWCRACRAHFPEASDEECRMFFDVFLSELTDIKAARCCTWTLAHVIEHTFFEKGGASTRH